MVLALRQAPRPALRAAVGLAAAALLATACGGGADGGTPSQELADGGTFTYSISADPGTLDPHQTVVSAAFLVGTFLYDRLVALTPDGTPVSNLASSWEADASAATFTLRDGVTCADGAPLTASDVKASFDYI